MTEKIATRDAYGQTLAELAATDEKLVVLDADLAKSTKTAEFAKAAPERFVEMGIAEQNMIGVAAGLATLGKHVFCSSFAIFAVGRAFEQVRNALAYPGLPVTVAATHAGITVGEDGATHQAIEDIALMRAVPNMTVIVPTDARETAQAVKALAEYDKPAYLRLGRLAVETVMPADYQFTIGKGYVLREGSDAVIFACGLMVQEAMYAAEQLAAEGINITVANMATVKPLDTELVIHLAEKCKAVVTAEEHNIIGGLGSAVAEVLSENCPTPLLRVGVADSFGQSGKPAELMAEYNLTAAAIAAKVREVIKRK
ncbi:MAG TPA: transketolase family protein [Candidatus Avidehalobacter gallistercoris]|uniref:Transketolase family protein n=1 Tax=Candidatus Avidehalobacter gallistercoris TaxID=2840694 RepID=A0A9D1KY19_9FIRM|nr:transketolase family protein [Candidatus Avidehalobacter gallistercoris]